ncbi:MAG: aminotransferase class V-fold PLP-dependent enzyme [Acidobacteria bacterium]|nr:aminotransferase class V-fold PLP-dependent enzyme [Acidobacteriota bacterium]MCW5948425.1 aminotransferase class V-fold PLP-dependent enzyme [Pyrinomonadaceae bacterium]
MDRYVRSLFPATESLAYLNSAAVAPLPRQSVEAVVGQLNDVASHGATHYNDWVATKERCRSLLASMIGAAAEEVAFVRNTSDGFSAIANGLDWSRGGNIVSFAGEFPANYYAWRRIRDEFGIELRLAREVDGRVDEDELVSMIDSRTRVVAISSIQFSTGYAADLERIGREARRNDALFCVDTIQGLGARSYDLPGLLVDAACGASHKWLCGPEGCGYVWLGPRAAERVKPTLVGWISVNDAWDFDDREQAFKPGALALESGTGPASLFYGLEASLELLTSIGLDSIERHVMQLANELCSMLDGTAYEVASSRRPGEASQTVAIRHGGGISAGQVAKELAAAGVIVSARSGRVRVAPHLFNDVSDIERLVRSLP